MADAESVVRATDPNQTASTLSDEVGAVRAGEVRIVATPSQHAARTLKLACTKGSLRSTLSPVRGGKGSFAMLLALAAVLMVAVPVVSAYGRVVIRTAIEPSGIGHLFASSEPGSLAWEACASDLTGCKPFGRGREVETKGAPPGTVFRVRYDEAETALSPEWRGPPKELAPPRVAGVIQANDYVTPVPGLWSGGWEGEPAELQFSACLTETGEGCVSLTDPQYIRRCPPSASFYLDPQFVGRYLRVADRQSGGPHAETAIGAISPYGAEVFGRSRTVSVAIVGQIAPAVNPPAGECGPSPAPSATVSADGVARVECGGGCNAVLIGTRKGRRVTIAGGIPEQNLLRPQELELQLSPASLARLGVGKIRLAVEIDGSRLVQRTIRSPGS